MEKQSLGDELKQLKSDMKRLHMAVKDSEKLTMWEVRRLKAEAAMNIKRQKYIIDKLNKVNQINLITGL